MKTFLCLFGVTCTFSFIVLLMDMNLWVKLVGAVNAAKLYIAEVNC